MEAVCTLGCMADRARISPDPIAPAKGWGVLHQFHQLTPSTDAEAVVAAVKELQAEESYQVVSFAVLGHKADVGFLALGPDLWRLRRFQTDLATAGLLLKDSFVSFTEASEYAKGVPEEYLKTRYYPTLPPEGMRAFCFYPMSKRRGIGREDHNWYREPYEHRHELMREHGASGRTFAGRIVQLITGSTGVDDWEWGVTLFAADPSDLKEVVYTMRFDEASAIYAEFGPFIAGLVGPIDEVLAQIR
jgi:hydrogen peroxide-dependent heme synthase